VWQRGKIRTFNVVLVHINDDVCCVFTAVWVEMDEMLVLLILAFRGDDNVAETLSRFPRRRCVA
jgi:hypothetical protein